MTGKISVRQLPVQRLNRSAFQPFGAVIEPETADSPNLNRSPGNLGMLWVQKALEFPTQPYMCCLRYYYRGGRCEFLQKHSASTVVLIPLGMRPSAFVVAPNDGQGRPAVEQATSFLLDGSKGVILHRGTWVRYAYPLGEFVDFAYVTQRVDPATANTTDDTVRANLDTEMGFVFDLVFDVPAGVGYEHGQSGAMVAGPPRTPPWR